LTLALTENNWEVGYPDQLRADLWGQHKSTLLGPETELGLARPNCPFSASPRLPETTLTPRVHSRTAERQPEFPAAYSTWRQQRFPITTTITKSPQYSWYKL